MGQTREQKIIKQLTNPQSDQKFTAIATDMFLPNHSGDHSAGIINTTPTADTDIPNKKYVDDAVAGGGGVTSCFSRVGAVIAEDNDYTWNQIDKTVSNISDIATKSHASLSDVGTNTHAQIDTHIADTSIHTEDNLLVHNSGDETVNGIKTFGSIPVLPSSNPTTDNQAVRKSYVDSYASGAIWKEACKMSTTGALPACTYSGTPNFTLTEDGAGVGLPNPDGIAPTNGDRLLVKNQATATQNGIYIITDKGTLGTPFVLTRAGDYNSSAEVQEGTCVFVISGTANGGKTFVQITIDPVLDTNNLVFTQMNQSTAYTASLGCELVGSDIRADLLANGGLELTGNELGVNTDDNSIEKDGTGNLRVKALGVTNAMLAGTIDDLKLNQIATSSKVHGSSLTNLSSIPNIASNLIPAINLGSGGAATDFLRKDQIWTTPAVGSESEVIVRLTADRTSNVVAFADCTGLSFSAGSIIAASEYIIEAFIIYQSAASTTGINLACNSPTPTILAGRTTANTNATAIAGRAFYAVNSSGGAMTAALVSPAYNIAKMNIYLKLGTVTGTFIIRFASEVAGSLITIKAGSFLRYRALV